VLTLGSKYLSDPTEDVRVATETILADFLREIKTITKVRKEVQETKIKQDLISAGTLANQEQEMPVENKEKAEESQAEFLADSVPSVAPSYKDEQDQSSIDSRDVGCKLSLRLMNSHD
jgi:vacuole morphology and inheritance protein 14